MGNTGLNIFKRRVRHSSFFSACSPLPPGERATQKAGEYICILCSLIILSCNQNRETVHTDIYPDIYPDYTDVTIPYNIAPLNFRIEGDCKKTEVTIRGKNTTIRIRGRDKISIPVHKWKRLLEEQKNDSVSVEVVTLIDGNRLKYKPFCFHVSHDMIDPYVSYRLIEPGYEVWNKLQIVERNISTFKERVLADNSLLGRGCINCHIFSGGNASVSFLHLRHENGGTLVQKNGVFRKLDTTTDSTISAGVYGSWHPSSGFIAFSVNAIIPGFHSVNNLRIEVYDTISDVVVADIDKNEIFTTSLLSDDKSFETFPVFSPDGKKLYFCSAKAVRMPENYSSVKYSLCSVDFNPYDGSFGTTVDTLVSSNRTGKTLSHPKPSPDGRYILYTSFDYGNFPVWHREADLHLLDLSDMNVDTMPAVNSGHADSYHSWSSNSKWFVFASKRDNGMYGKLYFAHIDENGGSTKPFVLPQKDPGKHDRFLKSYNIPELSDDPAPFDPADVERAFRKLPAESMNFVSR